MIGELKLTALKARLSTIGVHAELVGEGVLVCGAGAKQGSIDLTETVAVRKVARGKGVLRCQITRLTRQCSAKERDDIRQVYEAGENGMWNIRDA